MRRPDDIPHLFRLFKGRWDSSPSISLSVSEESEMRRPDDWMTTFSAQAVGFVAKHFLKRQRGKRNAKAGRLDNHLFHHFNKIGFVAMHFLKRQRGIRNAKAGRLDNHLFRLFNKIGFVTEHFLKR